MTAQSDWTRIGVAFDCGFKGVAFVNRDGSLSVQLDFIPSDPEVSIHIREPRTREDAPEQGQQTGERASC